ncbi:YciI family protein [Hephaestia sp. GCM10023244]|uniref:YciI family protein n=1 Tax=unclassified Hephaestia TaxID=2631281 RepID=UPI0020775A7A|nr:YciI family protein [Hephaestia sp. MAHUQ-44]MCM8729565.1 YciI family protein [Hephaestia sp. MAHUQ-44]
MTDGFRSSGPLSIILLTYVAPLEDVDAQLKAHVAWLEAGFAEGVFLIAGRRDPRVGGVIIARGAADEVAAIAQTDPFVTSGVATVELVPFNASFAAPEIAGLLA